MTLTEALQAKMSDEQKRKFREIFNHPNLQLVDVDRRIALKASTIREAYDTRTYDRAGNKIGGSFMSLGDGLHLATALQVGAKLMRTLDGTSKQHKRLDLLKLSGNVAGARLDIMKPCYVAPPTPLDGPVLSITSGGQLSLLETEVDANKPILPEDVNVTERKDPAVSASTVVRSGDVGNPEGEAGTTVKEGASGEIKESSEAEAVSQAETTPTPIA